MLFRSSGARTAFLAKFDDQVDPGRILSPEERTKRAANARKAYFANLARKSAAARRADGPRRQVLEELAAPTRLLAELTEVRGPLCASAVSGPEAETGTQSGGSVR